jgi:hypothetical protein
MRSIAVAAAVGSLVVLVGCANNPARGRDDVQGTRNIAGPPVASSAPATAPASQPDSAGIHFKLETVGDVFVPECFPAGTESPDLVIHFHGAPQVVQRELVAAGLRVVLVTVNYGGLSGVYEKPFSDASSFGTLLDETLAGLKERKLVAATAPWRRVCVSSFSAGFGAVRAILKVPAYFERIDALYLADTLYAGYVGEGDERKVNPENVRDFRRFAAEAVAGRKTMLITHSYLAPGTYAGTHETADDLIAFVHAERRSVDEAGPAGMHIVSRVDQGGLIVRGCAGQAAEDHMAHLRNMRFWYPLLAVDRIPSAR